MRNATTRTMTRYEHPVTHEVFLASTPEHAAARVYGGKPGDYLAIKHTEDEFHGYTPWAEWIEVVDNTYGHCHGAYVGEIHVPEQ